MRLFTFDRRRRRRRFFIRLRKYVYLIFFYYYFEQCGFRKATIVFEKRFRTTPVVHYNRRQMTLTNYILCLWFGQHARVWDCVLSCSRTFSNGRYTNRPLDLYGPVQSDSYDSVRRLHRFVAIPKRRVFGARRYTFTWCNKSCIIYSFKFLFRPKQTPLHVRLVLHF